MRLLAQSQVVWTPVDQMAFIEHGAAEEHVERIPYDPDLMKALVASGRLGSGNPQ